MTVNGGVKETMAAKEGMRMDDIVELVQETVVRGEGLGRGLRLDDVVE